MVKANSPEELILYDIKRKKEKIINAARAILQNIDDPKEVMPDWYNVVYARNEHSMRICIGDKDYDIGVAGYTRESSLAMTDENFTDVYDVLSDNVSKVRLSTGIYKHFVNTTGVVDYLTLPKCRPGEMSHVIKYNPGECAVIVMKSEDAPTIYKGIIQDLYNRWGRIRDVKNVKLYTNVMRDCNLLLKYIEDCKL